MEKIMLEIDKMKYRQLLTTPNNTIQFFITNKCNKRCRACFYAHNLGGQDMDLDLYKNSIIQHQHLIDKIILLGGEPTLCKTLPNMIELNQMCGLKTTVYTNGANLRVFDGMNLDRVKIRIGVYGTTTSEKPLDAVERTDLPVTIVFMLRQDNIGELVKVAKMAEEFNCHDFYISSIRDIAQTQNYWVDNEDTIPLDEYCRIIQKFIDEYSGNMTLHIARRGLLSTQCDDMMPNATHCRFGNIFPDGRKIICPMDISREIYSDNLVYGQRKCNKNDACILQKIVLQVR